MARSQFSMFSAIVLILLNLSKSGANEIFPCNLIWVQSSRGSQNNVELPITSDGSDISVARVPSSTTGEYDLGRVNMKTGNGYFPQNNPIQTIYEVLANTYDCNVEWVSPASSLAPKYVVKSISASTGSTWVGRGELPDGSLVAGSINPTTKQLSLVDNDGNIVTLGESSYDVLVSHSNGMELDIIDIVFDSDPFSGPVEMMGVDVVDNNAEATVEQTVEHVKVTSESYKFRTTITSVKKIRIFLCLFFCSITSRTSSSRSEYSSQQDKEVKASRSFKVPAMTSVEACSTFSKQDNFDSTWSARAVFTSKGLNGLEISQILKADPNWSQHNLIPLESSVETTITGSFKGAFVTSSRTYIVDKSKGSCSQLQEYLNRSKTERLQGQKRWTFQDSLQQEAEIASIFAFNKNKIL